MRYAYMTSFGFALCFAACLSDPSKQAPDQGGTDALEEIHSTDVTLETTDDGPVAATPPALRVITFNTGTSLMPSGATPNRGYGPDQWKICDDWYGNGLSWKNIMDDTRAWIAETDPDVIVFQEVFDSNECAEVPQEHWPGFVCEDWAPGEPIVAQMILGDDWQVMCNPIRTDKCAAVNRRVGSFRGCDGDLCLEGMEGNPIDGCSKGVRIGRGVVDLVDGGVLTLVNVHGSSGFSAEDMDCRGKQFAQAYEDNGSGEPAANGDWNLVMGDYNVDPVVMAGADPSADALNSYVGPGKAFHFITETDPDSPGTYAGYARIDHVTSDTWVGTCWHAGITAGHPPVTPAVSFDHRPAVCDVTAKAADGSDDPG